MTALATTLPAVGKTTRMRFVDVLAAPRYAGSRATQWWAIGFFVLLTVAALAGGMLIPDRRSTELALLIYAFGAALVTMWLAMLLLMARDARRLGLPGVGGHCTLAMCVYALAIVAGPAALVAATGGDVGVAILFPALAIAASLAYMLLPIVISGWLGIVPAIYIGLHNAFHVPSPFDPRFQQGAWIALAILLLIAVVRWRQFLRADGDEDGLWRRTMLTQMRGSILGKWSNLDQRWGWRRAAKKTEVDFRGIGPGKPAATIAVALGGWYVPQAARARMASLARVLVPVLLFVPLMLLINVGHELSLRKAWQIIGVSGGLWVGMFGSIMLALLTGTLLQRRWKQQADMALLALLPGIDGAHAGVAAARAALTKPAIALVVFWLCMLVPLLHGGPVALLLASLIMVGIAAVTAMAALQTMAGRPLRVRTVILLGVAVFVLLNASGIFGVAMSVTKFGVWGERAQLLVLLLWLALAAWATWRAFAAWRVLQRRPHPFLANAP